MAKNILTPATRADLQTQATELNTAFAEMMGSAKGKAVSSKRQQFEATCNELLNNGASPDEIRDTLRETGEDKAAMQAFNQLITERNKAAGETGATGGGGGSTEAEAETDAATDAATDAVATVEGKPIAIRAKKGLRAATGSLLNSKLAVLGAPVADTLNKKGKVTKKGRAAVIDLESTEGETFVQRDAIRAAIIAVAEKVRRNPDSVMTAIWLESVTDADNKQRAEAKAEAKAKAEAEAIAKADAEALKRFGGNRVKKAITAGK